MFYQPIPMIGPYYINVHTEFSNGSTAEQTADFQSRMETEVPVWEVRSNMKSFRSVTEKGVVQKELPRLCAHTHTPQHCTGPPMFAH